MALEYVYITSTDLGGGELAVEGRTAEGRLVFGFRAVQDAFRSWKDKARRYAGRRIPAFVSPVRLR